MNNNGPHGFSEILYAFSSATGNNGSAFAGLYRNTPWYNTTLGLAMLFGRFLMIVPILALAGSLVQKKVAPASAGTFPVSRRHVFHSADRHGAADRRVEFSSGPALGPIVEHFLMQGENFFKIASKLMTAKTSILFLIGTLSVRRSATRSRNSTRA